MQASCRYILQPKAIRLMLSAPYWNCSPDLVSYTYSIVTINSDHFNSFIYESWNFNFYMVSSWSNLLPDFETVFVFALGWFFTPSVFFYDLGGNLHWDDLKWPKNHFRVVKRWFWAVECMFWGHISIEKCFYFFRSDTGSAIFRVRKIAFFAFLTHYMRFYAL